MNINNKTLPQFSLTTISLALMLSIGLTACGGGGGGVNAPSANNFSPADGASAVELDATVSATFDRDMFAITVVDTNFTLENNLGEAVAASVDYDVLANRVNLNSNANLSLLTQYTANLTPGITDLDGNPLADTQWQFTTRDGDWQTVKTVRGASVNSTANPKIATNKNGDSIAVWQQDGHIWSFQSDVLGNNFIGPEKVDTGISAGGAQVTLDDEGNAIAVWVQNEGTISNIWANRFTPETGWVGAERIEIESGRGNAHRPQIAADTNGNIIAVWYRRDGDDYFSWSNRFTPENRWGIAEKISSDARLDKISVGNNGNAMVIWSRPRFNNDDDAAYFSKRFTPSTGWNNPAQLIESGQNISLGNIEFDDEGNAVVILNNRSDLWLKRYTTVGGWSEAEPVKRSDSFVSRIFSPKITIDSNGRILAIWQERESRQNLWANHFTKAEGWGDAELIETNDIGNVEVNQLVTDKNGNGLAIWEQSDGTRTNLWSNRFTLDGSWGIVKAVEIENGGNVYDAHIVMGDDGTARAIWTQYNGAGYDLKLNRFK